MEEVRYCGTGSLLSDQVGFSHQMEGRLLWDGDGR